MSLSLSDLIYGSSQSQHDLLTPQDNLSTDPSSPQHGSGTSNTYTPIKQDPTVDHYYKSPFTSSQNTPQRPKKKIKYDFESNNEDRIFFGVTSRPKHADRHTKRLRAKTKIVFDATVGSFIKIDDETKEVRADRLNRIKEKRNIYIRRRNNPRWNFRNEVDIGGAMGYVIQKEMSKERKKTRKLKKEKALKRNEDGDGDDADSIDHNLSSDDEIEESAVQSQTQSQLDLMLTKAQSLQTPATVYSDPKEDASHPLHYLWLGRCAPAWSDVKYNYLSLLQEMRPRQHHNCIGKDAVLKILIDGVTRNNTKRKGREDNMSKFICNDAMGMDERRVTLQTPLLDLGHSTATERRKCPAHAGSKRKVFLRERTASGASFNQIHEEAKKVQSTVARYLVGCAGVLPHMPKEMIEQMLDMLHRCSSTTDSPQTIIRQSQTLASNLIMWNEINPTMKQLCAKGYLSCQDYDCIREELLSSDAECFTDPWLTTSMYDCYDRSTTRRKRIHNFVENLQKRHLDNGMKRKRDERDELDSDEESSTSLKQKEDKGCAPWQVQYSEKLAKKVTWSNMTHTEMGEKYSQVVHYATTSVATTHLTLSFLFSLMPRLKASSADTSAKLHTIHQELELFLSKLSSSIWCSSGNPAGYESVPLNAPLAYATLMTQSYVANSGMYGTNKEVKEEEEGYVSSDSSDSGSIVSQITNDKMPNESSIDFNEVANILAARGQLHLRDNKLKIFKQIHLTTGVSILAKCFTSRGAEILSRPCFTGGVTQDSPFDLVRLAIEEADKYGGIQRNATIITYGSHVIHTEELIREFDNAAEVFHDILTCAPSNLACHCWYAAARIGSTIVASGIDIGKGARIAMPHEYSMEDLDKNSFLRSRHTKYNDLRAAASDAIRTLLDLNNNASIAGHVYHYAVTSLLEWKEAIGLLAMRPHLNKQIFQCIKELHAYHTISWALEERTEESLKKVLVLSQSGLLSSNHVMCLLARIIEKDPNNPISWLALSSILPVKDEISLTKLRSKSYWWASKVAPSWNSHFFATPLTFDPRKSLNYRKDIENLIAIKKYVIKAGEDIDSLASQNDVSSQLSCLKHKVKFKAIGKEWLWPTAPSDEDEEDHLDIIDDDGEIRMFDHDLPIDFRETETDFHLIVKLLEGGGESEVIAAKALIAHHLYGSCSYTHHAVYFLMRKGDCTDENCIGLKLLTWLAKMKLDVTGSINALISMLKRHNRTSRIHSQIRFKFASF